ncbi:MAG TPA: tRNA glutamyl-Q(34) synthetase GluQRS [Burkholderiales bacterium]|nr:tRNA glutamyl-Q(34) synthetase GluQRS [Burkholderiales bacterium]
MKPYCGRFAPSPTGPLHFGSLVAAVGSYLDARAHDGEWLVRIEDLDRPRVVRGAADEILRTLEAFGMCWDRAIVYQSAHSDAYHAALHQLRGRDRLYACACTRSEVADSAITGIQGFVYPATCRAGLPARRAARTWRVNTQGAIVGFEDAIQGRLEHDLEKQIGDFILYRADSIYAYQLAVCVDDAEQGVTDVVRGADLLDSTPRQIYLQRLLGLPTLRYAHLPVATNAEGAKLSKQTLARPVDSARAAELLIAVLHFLGQDPPMELQTSALEEVWRWAFQNWTIARVPRRRAQRSPQP